MCQKLAKNHQNLVENWLEICRNKVTDYRQKSTKVPPIKMAKIIAKMEHKNWSKFPKI